MGLEKPIGSLSFAENIFESLPPGLPHPSLAWLTPLPLTDKCLGIASLGIYFLLFSDVLLTPQPPTHAHNRQQ